MSLFLPEGLRLKVLFIRTLLFIRVRRLCLLSRGGTLVLLLMMRFLLLEGLWIIVLLMKTLLPAI
jgi:hypothetical protein